MTNFKTFQIILFTLIVLILCIEAHHNNHEDSSPPPLDHDHDHHNVRAKSLILVKIWCLSLVFLGTFVAGLSPCFFKWNDSFLVLGTQFSGGVFMGTALIHFLSDANETFRELTSKEYPFAFMLACFGYLLTMAADCLIFYVHNNKPNNDNYTLEEGISDGKPTTNNQHHPNTTQSQAYDHSNITKLTQTTSVGDTVLLITALCFHSIFEGIAIGISETEADAWRSLWTISLHKVFAAVAMSIALLRLVPDRPLVSCACYSFLFAVSSPVGVGIGIVVDQAAQGVVADWVYGVSMGVASGVFVYVSINHLMDKGQCPKSKGGVDGPFYRFLAVGFGVGVIAIVMIWDT